MHSKFHCSGAWDQGLGNGWQYNGCTLLTPHQKLEEGEVDVHDVQVLIDVVTALKHDLEDRMGLVRALYFNYVHLVKRAAIPGTLISIPLPFYFSTVTAF